MSLRAFLNQLALTAATASLALAPNLCHAVQMNGSPIGSVLIYPYYTVRNGQGGAPYFSALSIENLSAVTLAARVRLREAKAGQVVGQFNLYLPAKTVWTGALLAQNSGAMLVTASKSCTSPASIKTTGLSLDGSAYQKDGGGNDLSRTQEGWIEVLQMGKVLPGSALDSATKSNGNCDATVITSAETSTTPEAWVGRYSDDLNWPDSSALAGTLFMVNINNGTSYSVDATALQSFSNQLLYTAPGGDTPSLEDASPAVALLQDANPARTGFYKFARGIDAVSAVLMVAQVQNNFSIESATASATDWVLTAPTKPHLTLKNSTTKTWQPFQHGWSSIDGKACDDMILGLRWRDNSVRTASDISLCYASNVLHLGSNRSVLGSAQTASFTLPSNAPEGGSLPEAGSANLRIDPVAGNSNAHRLPASSGTQAGYSLLPAQTWVGLPLIGFAVNDASNGTLTLNGKSVISNYGYTMQNRNISSIE